MSINRRSLLRTIAALPAAYYLDSERLLWAQPAHDCSSADSIFVLLEGPWVIWQESGSLKAFTTGDSVDHCCAVELWTCGSRKASWTDLEPGPAVTLSGKFQTSDYDTLITNAFNTNNRVNHDSKDNFAWISGATVMPPTPARQLCLPMPSAVHTAGYLFHADVTSNNSKVLKAEHIRSHITTILEYAQIDSSKPNALLYPTSSGTQKVSKGQHLIIRLEHVTTGDDTGHIKKIFESNAHSVFINQSTDLIDIQIDTDTSYDLGNDTAGFAEDELGLDQALAKMPSRERAAKPIQNHPQPRRHDNTYANCAGGGIIVGP